MKPKYFPQFPLYIVSKSRHQYNLTSKALTSMGVSHYIVVEPDQVEDYQQSVIKDRLLATILPLDMTYKDKYELLDDLGLTKSTGPGPARNFAWDHSIKNGFTHHWVMDDNIRTFHRLYNNEKIITTAPGFWQAMEDFALRYKNVAMSGPNYFMFACTAMKLPPLVVNTRIYSCNLIRNDVPFRWRGRYNEDTILSLDMLTHGWCTIQYNVFLQYKLPTQTLKGGNTQDFYHAEGVLKEGAKYATGGTDAKTLMLKAVYPDLTEVVFKFGRTHHSVDYSSFKNMKLIRDENVPIPDKCDYGMVLVRKS